MVNSTRKATTTTLSATPVSNSVKDTSNSLNEFSKAILLLSNKQEAFVKSVEVVNQFVADIRSDLRTDIQAKWLESENLKTSVANERKNLEIETEQNIKQFKYKAAVEILTARDEVPIMKSELQQLRDELARTQKDIESRIETALTMEKDRSKRAVESAVNQCRLKHAAESAELRAKVDQQTVSNKNLLENIVNLKEEVAAQRQLTKEVAMAGKQGAISQYMGKQT